nr:reverse transcriptase domain-containing protein [Tanacetum cinerariifolium]
MLDEEDGNYVSLGFVFDVESLVVFRSRFCLEVRSQMVPATTPLVGFSGEIIWPLGQISLLVKIGNEEHSTSIQRNHRKARGKDDPGSPIHSSRNSKIPSDGWKMARSMIERRNVGNKRYNKYEEILVIILHQHIAFGVQDLRTATTFQVSHSCKRTGYYPNHIFTTKWMNGRRRTVRILL